MGFWVQGLGFRAAMEGGLGRMGHRTLDPSSPSYLSLKIPSTLKQLIYFEDVGRGLRPRTCSGG